jgi:hypothetical protein
MSRIIGPINSGIAAGIEGAATNDADSPTIVSGKINSVYIKYTVVPTATTDVIVNGLFAADTDWTKGANWTIASDKASAAAADANLTAAVDPLTVGKTYYVVYTLVVTTGTIRISDGVTHGTTRSASGTYAELFTAGDEDFEFDPVATFTGSVSNVAAYEYDPHADTDVIISTKGNSTPSYDILTVSTSMTDGIYRPRATPCGTDGAALIALTVLEPIPVHDYVNVKIDDSVPGDYVDVWLLID